MNSIETIDIKDLFGNDLEKKIECAKLIEKNCKKTGFFAISNHGIKNLDQLSNLTYDFFKNLSNEEKLNLAPNKWNPKNKNNYRGYFPLMDTFEGYDIGNTLLDENHDLIKNNVPMQEINVWPRDELIPGFRSFVTDYYLKMIDLADVLLKGFALAANKPENFFEKYFNKKETMSTLRLNYYPFSDDLKPVEIAKDGTPIGLEEHTDGCLVTILYQPVVGGLQIETENGWIDVEPMPDKFVINTGKCMSLLTDEIFKPANHRVKSSNKERISIPFFTELSYNTDLRDCSLFATNKVNTTYGDYITESNKQFKEYQRKTN